MKDATYNRQANGTDDSYYHAGGLDPWTLERAMQSTGFAFVDARRADIIEYAFRLKGWDDEDPRNMLIKLREDLTKARDNAIAAVGEIDRILSNFEKDEEERRQGQVMFDWASRERVDSILRNKWPDITALINGGTFPLGAGNTQLDLFKNHGDF